MSNEKSFSEAAERSILSDLSQLSINCGEERPTYRSRKISCKTPRKNGLRERDKSGKTPNKSQTPSGGDRYIPNFSLVDKEVAHFKLLQEDKARTQELPDTNVNTIHDNNSDTSKEQTNDPNTRFDLLTEGSVSNSKILSLANQSRVLGMAPKVGFACSSQKSSTVKSSRHIPSEPIKALDAPDLSNDFYLNLVDWSVQNFLAVALVSGVYMWNAATGEIVDFVDFGDEKTVTSIKFQDEGCHIGIGLSDGSLLIYDTETKERLRSLKGHSQRVCSLSWNEFLLCSGSRSGMILTHDARARTTRPEKILTAHEEEVCSLNWNSAKTYLASGSSDATVKIWNLADMTDNRCMTTLSGHLAAVKAVCWCPYDSHTIATGGGGCWTKCRFLGIRKFLFSEELSVFPFCTSQYIWAKGKTQGTSGKHWNYRKFSKISLLSSCKVNVVYVSSIFRWYEFPESSRRCLGNGSHGAKRQTLGIWEIFRRSIHQERLWFEWCAFCFDHFFRTSENFNVTRFSFFWRFFVRNFATSYDMRVFVQPFEIFFKTQLT